MGTSGHKEKCPVGGSGIKASERRFSLSDDWPADIEMPTFFLDMLIATSGPPAEAHTPAGDNLRDIFGQPLHDLGTQGLAACVQNLALEL